MTNMGRIEIRKSGDFCLVTNAGVGIKGAHAVTMNFLEANRPHFDKVATGAGYASLAVRLNRLPKFLAHCAEHGIEVVGA